ncbi:alpha/beta fold hydrolase [Oryzobacter telluris]|uniref:alpha/beta fold hydrolase n=1 Tax=Oryzobacter telluris TaxID=3149179 RepID=UPI00370CFBFA
MAERAQVRRGTSATGMDHASWGDGDRTLLFIGGGPGGNVPSGRLSRTTQRWFEPFTAAGHTVNYVSRRRGMPPDHTVEDIADDYGRFVRDELGGRVDLLVGVSFGGMVAQHLAARHGDLLGRVAVVAAAAEVSDSGKDVDARLARAVERGDRSAVGATFAEYALRGRRWGWLRRLAGPVVGRMLTSGADYPTSDVVVEAQAELGFDARAALPGIRVPVVLLCGDADPFFPARVVKETAALVPRCTVQWYPGRGHLWVASSRTVPPDVLRLVGPEAPMDEA